jgi:hypothetical protein
MAKGKGKGGLNTDSLRDFDEYEGALNSITNTLGKQSDIYALINKKLEATKTLVGSIADKIDNATDLEDKHKKSIYAAAEAYKKSKQTIAESNLELKKGNITQEEYNKAVQESYKSYEKVVSAIDTSNKSAKRTVSTLNKMGNEMKSFAEAAKKSEERMEQLGTALDELGSSGIPVMDKISGALKNIANKDAKGAKLAIVALGAAIGGLAANYFGAPLAAAIQAGNDIKQTEIDRAKEVGSIESERRFIDKKIGMELNQSRIDSANEVNRLTIDAAYAQQRAANQFSATMKSAAAEFSAASKTAFFGNAIGGVGYASAQMQMAGIGADRVAGAMSAAAEATGRLSSAKVGADMAIMASRTGQSEESIASISEAFMRMDGLSESSALNMQEGLRAMADSAKIDLGGLMSEMAESSKDMLGYQIKSTSALAKQITFAKTLGVKFGDIAKAGQSMVLNYQDSIKAEMQLSAMLGKNVDLSEVRAKFASGDTEGALKSLQAQGLDPKSMDMFQQQQLSSALGGMDLATLSKVATNTGRSGGNLQAGNATAGNKSFLQRSTNAQASLASQQAQISADQAIVDAKLSQQITEAYLTSDGYKTYQNALADQAVNQANLNAEITKAFQNTQAYIDAIAQTNQLATERAFTENLISAGGAILGGVVGNALGGKIEGIIAKKVGTKVASKTATTAGKTVASTAGKTAAKTAGKVGTKTVAKVGAKAVGKSLLKKIPVVGLLAGVGFGLSRLMDGDYTGAAMELASGAAGTIPGIGTAASVGIDTALAAKDMGAFDKKAATPAKPAATPTKAGATPAKAVAAPAAVAATKAVAATGGTSVISAAKASEKWMQGKLTYMSGNLEKVVDRTHKTMMNTAATTTELKTLNTNTKALVNLTRTIEALTVATFEGSRNVSVSIDGKKVAYAFDKYKENTRGGDPDQPAGPKK